MALSLLFSAGMKPLLLREGILLSGTITASALGKWPR